MLSVSLNVNGRPVTATVEPRTQLCELLREELNLTGTHLDANRAFAVPAQLSSTGNLSAPASAMQATVTVVPLSRSKGSMTMR